MAMNLIEQQTALRDLPDEALQQAMSGGLAPPYLVLAEINRRKDARERYLSQKQKYDADRATVAQNVMDQLAQVTQAATSPAPGAGGLADVMGGAMSPTTGGLDTALADTSETPSYAQGGVVHKFVGGGGLYLGNPYSAPLGPTVPATTANTSSAYAPPPAPAAQSLANFSFSYPKYQNPYASLMDLYSSQLGDINKQRDDARAMALIMAGTGMMQGGQNTLKNIGAAFGPAMQNYQSQINSINQSERDMLREKAGLQAQSTLGEQQYKTDFENSMKGRAQIAEEMGLEPGTPEYESYVVGNQLSSTAKGEMKNVIDDMGNIKTALVRGNKFYDAGTGAEMPGVRLLDDVTKADMIAKNKGQLIDEQAFKSTTRSLAADKREYSSNMDRIQRAKDFIAKNRGSVGDFKSLLNLPAAASLQLKGMLNGIESGAVMKMLLSLREAAAKLGQQGTGFGQLTEQELSLLKKSIADLNDANNPDVILQNLDIVANQYGKLMAAAESDYQMAYQKLIENAAQTGDDSLVKKFITENRLNDFTTDRESIYVNPAGSGPITPDLGLGTKADYATP